ncbi:hypothetical protein DMZ73_25500 [Salmonella enterica subsp. enterica serovar Inganda]|nr:hypothetical protein [Salmonella enterica subsp. enterica serovar Inganda]ECH8971155.1 hypothetical protein [Salmonella enterica subsp. enterica]EDU0272515.1 hypothetical protein [Salmonella enterica subsp. enterica serovar Glostrup]EDU9603847.1 hypothetical protein [Salmonella enterica subsp. enterica]
MYKTDRFRTLLTVPVQNLVKLVSYTRYNSYIHFVQKITPCHEFLLIAVYPHWNRQLKTSAGKLKQLALPLNPSA